MTDDEPDTILVAGDWHGNLPWAQKVIHYAATKGAQVILHVGDFGYWVPSPATERYLDGVQGALKKAGITLYWVDGNHEAFDRFSEWNEPEHAAAHAIPGRNRIIHLPRGFRWTWWGKTWMSLGGAHSVDRQMRTEGIDWWPEEHLTDEQVEHASREGKVHIVIAHDCPEGVAIPGILPARQRTRNDWPEMELIAAEQHRELVRQVFDAVTPDVWVHGHYHVPYQAHLNGCLVVGLDRDGSHWMSDHTLLLKKEDLRG